jgi:hypothetical protein
VGEELLPQRVHVASPEGRESRPHEVFGSREELTIAGLPVG